MTQEKLVEILIKHIGWLKGEDSGKRAILRGENLSFMDLSGHNLSYADLSYTKLVSTNLSYTDLSYTDLTNANLVHANMTNSIMIKTKLASAKLTGAVFPNTALHLQCPEEGSFIAWKKLANDEIAKLLIPEDAKRSSATTRKCRASKAIVLAIYDADGAEVDEGRSAYYTRLVYRVGETVCPDSWDEDRWNECSHGIHFFITRREAEEY